MEGFTSRTNVQITGPKPYRFSFGGMPLWRKGEVIDLGGIHYLDVPDQYAECYRVLSMKSSTTTRGQPRLNITMRRARVQKEVFLED